MDAALAAASGNIFAGLELWFHDKLDPKVLRLLKSAGMTPRKIVTHLAGSLGDGQQVDRKQLHSAVKRNLRREV